MKILIIGNIFSLSMNELVGLLHKKKNEVYVLDFLHGEYHQFDEQYTDYVSERRISHRKNPSKIIRTIVFVMNFITGWRVLKKNHYDVCNIHFTHFYYFLFSSRFKKQAGLFICSIYGSDFNEANSLKRYFLARLMTHADYITFNNEKIAQVFNRYYFNKFRDKVRICRFGFNHLTTIEKIQSLETKIEVRKRLQLPVNKTILTCGYGRSRNNQHEKIIHAIAALPSQLKKNIFLIFPMTYGSDLDQINIVHSLMDETSVHYRVNTVFLPDEIACAYIVASDIMVNIPAHDQLNGAIQEMLFAGNIVINGSWLPYEVLYSRGIDALKVDRPEALTDQLKQLLSGYYRPDKEKNRKIITELAGWGSAIKSWTALYYEKDNDHSDG